MIPPAIRTAVRDFASAHALLRPGPLVVAVSGGTDSTALLLLLADLREEFGLDLHVAHFDHRTRPAEAAGEAQHVADLAARAGATFRAGRAERRTRSENEAREARYAFLARAAQAVGASVVATGHTRDDQAETVLLHLVRGSGLSGVGGMRPFREGIVRPLLAIGRAETAAICAAEGIDPREDPTNRSLRFARNRIRRRVMPELAHINPRVAEALARFAEAAAADDAALATLASASVAAARDGDAIVLARLAREPALRGRALAEAWARSGGGALDAKQRAALLALASTTDGSAGLDLSGGRAIREYGHLWFERSAPAAPPDDGPQALRLDDAVVWHGWRLELTVRESAEYPLCAAVPRTDGLVVRGRRAGDRLVPGAWGASGASSRKVQDVLVDAKLPAALRDRQPLIATADGAVLWVVGIAGGTPPDPGGLRVYARPPDTGHHFWSARVDGNSIKR